MNSSILGLVDVLVLRYPKLVHLWIHPFLDSSICLKWIRPFVDLITNSSTYGLNNIDSTLWVELVDLLT